MTADADRFGGAKPEQDYRNLPSPVRLDETIASHDPNPVADPQVGRNAEQDRALRDV